jgi:DNA-binding protein YbaB
MYSYGDEELAELETLIVKLADIEGNAESQDGFVRAVTDRLGQLKKVDLDPRIYHYSDAPGLARMILRTVWEAAHDADHQAFELLRPWLPPQATREEVDTVFDPLIHQVGRRAGSQR